MMRVCILQHADIPLHPSVNANVGSATTHERASSEYNHFIADVLALFLSFSSTEHHPLQTDANVLIRLT